MVKGVDTGISRRVSRRDVDSASDEGDVSAFSPEFVTVVDSAVQRFSSRVTNFRLFGLSLSRFNVPDGVWI